MTTFLVAQQTPNDLICKPTSAAEVIQFNEIIAQYYAPTFRQQFSQNYPPEFDYIRAFDYDGDWVSNNNFNNIFSTGDGFFPKIYYSVVWTNKYWVVAYGVFHPLDYADVGFNSGDPLGSILAGLGLCMLDVHENDTEGVVYVIKRPTHVNNASVVAYETICHSTDHCYQNQGYEDLFYIDNGTHCILPNTSFPFNPCDPSVSSLYMDYLPPRLSSSPPGFNGLGNNSVYLLESMHAPGGVWSQRNNPQTFINVNGKHKMIGDEGKDNAASAPWNWGSANASNPFGTVCGLIGSPSWYEVNEFKNIRYNYNSAVVNGPNCIPTDGIAKFVPVVHTASCPILSYKWEVSYNYSPYQTVSTSPVLFFSQGNPSATFADIRLKITATDGSYFYSIPKRVTFSDDCGGGGPIIFRSDEEENLTEAIASVNSTIYPNPTSGILHIRTDGETKPMDVQVFEMSTGKLVASFESIQAEQSIQLDDLSSGIYLIKIVNDQVNDTHKFTIVK